MEKLSTLGSLRRICCMFCIRSIIALVPVPDCRPEKEHRDGVEAAVFSAIGKLNELRPPTGQVERSRDALLLADGTSLDSMAIVNLLVFVEEEMSAAGHEITLVGAEGESEIDAAALETVGTLIDSIRRTIRVMHTDSL